MGVRREEMPAAAAESEGSTLRGRGCIDNGWHQPMV